MRLCSTFTLAIALASAAALAVGSAHAQTYKVLYSLPSGAPPSGIANLGPSPDNPGYVGVTTAGGFVGSGTLFTLSAAGAFSVIGQFDGYTGYAPQGPSYFNFISGSVSHPYYVGTTQGGANNGGAIWGYNIESGEFGEIYNFCAQSNCADGESPSSGLAEYGDGSGFGTTYSGGEYGYGTVYECGGVTSAGCNPYRLYYSFTGGSDGANPAGDLLALATAVGYKGIVGVTGVYGTTVSGGAYGYGTIFELVPCEFPPCSVKTLHSFEGPPGDGQFANGVIVQVGSGSAHSFLYGTTQNGGAHGEGTVFQFDLTSGAYTVLHSFTGGSDGYGPEDLVAYGTGGVLYGTSSSGGANGYGALWQLSGTTLTTLHAFCSTPACPEGGQPGPIILPWDAPGDIVGTAYVKGANGAGVVYQYTP